MESNNKTIIKKLIDDIKWAVAHNLTPHLYFSTKDYDLFRYMDENRPISENFKQKLIRAATEKPLFPFYPGLATIATDEDDEYVLDENGNIILYIDDGQHRLEAAREIGQRYYFVLSTSSDVMDIATANANRKRWSLIDYTHYWATTENKRGIKNGPYTRLLAMMEKYPGAPLSSVINISDGDGANARQRFKKGEFVFGSERFVERVLIHAFELEKFGKFTKSSGFVSALATIMMHDRYKENRMLKKVERRRSRFYNCATIEEYKSMIADMYNYGNSKNIIYIP